jgi:hypothetical protein
MGSSRNPYNALLKIDDHDSRATCFQSKLAHPNHLFPVP